jgi:hypothetical protein
MKSFQLVFYNSTVYVAEFFLFFCVAVGVSFVSVVTFSSFCANQRFRRVASNWGVPARWETAGIRVLTLVRKKKIYNGSNGMNVYAIQNGRLLF